MTNDLKITDLDLGYEKRYPKLLEPSTKQFEKQLWFASHQVRVATNDVEMMRELDRSMNQRSFDIGNGVET